MTIGHMANVQLAIAGDETTQVILSVPGVQGPAGSNLPPSGTTNQVLYKQSNTDYDTGWSLVTSAMITDGTIVNGDINGAAAIAGTKISPNFGSQNVVTTGTSTAASFIPTSSGVPANGLYLPSANNVAISTGGSGRLFIDASGRVHAPNSTAIGPGTSTPTRTLQLSDTTGQPAIKLTNDTSGHLTTDGVDLTFTGTNLFITNREAGAIVAEANGSERLRITSTGTVNIIGAGTAGSTQAVSFNGSAPVNSLVVDSQGRLGIGATSPLYPLHVEKNQEDLLALVNAGVVTYRLQVKNDASLAVVQNSVERMRITSSGLVQTEADIFAKGGIFVSDPITTSRYLYKSSTGGGTATVYIGNAAIQVSSDARLKDNIQNTTLSAVEELQKVRVVDFTWNDPSDTSYNNRNARGTWTGVIAQEIIEVFPFAVNAPRKEDDLSIDHDSDSTWTVEQQQLVPVLIKAIQEQQAVIADLQSRLTALESA